jgi:hypothetical protein
MHKPSLMMKYLMISLLGGLMLASCAPTPNPDEDAAVKCFYDYQKALLDKDGEAASALVDSSTIQYYDEILYKAIYANSEAFDQSNLMERVSIAMLRCRYDPEEALEMDGRALFVHAVSSGMVGTDRVKDLRARRVTMEGDRAYIQHTVIRNSPHVAFMLVKEKDGWKMNLTASFEIVDSALKVMLRDEGMSEDEYIESRLLEHWDEDEIPRYWEPLVD